MHRPTRETHRTQCLWFFFCFLFLGRYIHSFCRNSRHVWIVPRAMTTWISLRTVSNRWFRTPALQCNSETAAKWAAIEPVFSVSSDVSAVIWASQLQRCYYSVCRRLLEILSGWPTLQNPNFSIESCDISIFLMFSIFNWKLWVGWKL